MAAVKDIKIKIVGTPQDVKLLKKILNFYLDKKASEGERHHIDCYLDLIDYAVKRANEAEELTWRESK